MSRLSKTVLVLAIAVGLWMLLAPNYLRTSLIYWYANLDDYTIFENKEVSVENGADWADADNYNKQE